MMQIKRICLVLSVSCYIFLFNIGQATSAIPDKLGLSDYKHFIIYPHLNKAFTALENKNEKIALNEFERALQLAPNNKALTLYLLEAYRFFNKNEQAERLIVEQSQKYPELKEDLEASYYHVVKVNSADELRDLKNRCDESPTHDCRFFVGHSAIAFDQLALAIDQLQDEQFAESHKGLSLQNEVLQKVIYLQDWQQVDQILSTLYCANRLPEEMKKVWFYALLQDHQDLKIMELQQQGLFTDIDDYLSHMNVLHSRQEKSLLANALTRPMPEFQTAEQEKSWIFLLTDSTANPEAILDQYVIKFADNKIDYIHIMLPWYLSNKNYDQAEALLKEVDQDQFIKERYHIRLNRANNHEELAATSVQVYAENRGNFELLDELSWNLIAAGENQQALKLLLVEYPKLPEHLIQRVFHLVGQESNSLSKEQRALLAQPLLTVDGRLKQSQAAIFGKDCTSLERIVGSDNLLSSYNVETLMALGFCYQKHAPKQALKVFEMAYQKKPSSAILKNIAYQLFSLGEYQQSLEIWNKLPLQELSDNDLMAAAITAEMLQECDALHYWLDKISPNFQAQSVDYWRLHAKTHAKEALYLAIEDLTIALSREQNAALYRERANLYRQQGDLSAAISDYETSLRLNPADQNAKIELGYLLWDMRLVEASEEIIEEVIDTISLTGELTDEQNLELEKHLVYTSSYLGNDEKIQVQAKKVIDAYSLLMVQGFSEEDIQSLYDFRRTHETAERKWRVNFNTSIGLLSNGTEQGGDDFMEYNTGGREQYNDGRSYAQLEVEYKLGHNQLRDGDTLSLYGRLSGNTGTGGGMIPSQHLRLGLGVRWKPFREQIIFLAAEAQIPNANLMLRASASFFNNGKYSDEWHPNGHGWFAQNLYLDAAYYVSDYVRSWTADYRVSWHHKIQGRSTIEPYAHIQRTGYHHGSHIRKTTFAGVGVRWNIWYHESRYNAWEHKTSVGIEYQRAIDYYNTNHRLKNRNKIVLTLNIDL